MPRHHRHGGGAVDPLRHTYLAQVHRTCPPQPRHTRSQRAGREHGAGVRQALCARGCGSAVSDKRPCARRSTQLIQNRAACLEAKAYGSSATSAIHHAPSAPLQSPEPPAEEVLVGRVLSGRLRVCQPVAAGGDHGLPLQQRMASTTCPQKRTSHPGPGEISDTRCWNVSRPITTRLDKS